MERILGFDSDCGNLATEARISMRPTLLPTEITVAAASISSKLFGGYGVGLCSLGLLSSFGTFTTSEALKLFTGNTKAVSHGTVAPRATWKTAEQSRVAKELRVTVTGISMGAAIVSSFSSIAV